MKPRNNSVEKWYRWMPSRYSGQATRKQVRTGMNRVDRRVEKQRLRKFAA